MGVGFRRPKSRVHNLGGVVLMLWSLLCVHVGHVGLLGGLGECRFRLLSLGNT